MKICGVELAGCDAVICLLYLDRGQFTLPDCRVRKLSLQKAHTQDDLQKFQRSFAKLMVDYCIDKVVIKERLTKGKFAGGAISFKLESAIQLIPNVEVELITPKIIKSSLSESPLPIPLAETDLKVFQEAAFHVAYVAHTLK